MILTDEPFVFIRPCQNEHYTKLLFDTEKFIHGILVYGQYVLSIANDHNKNLSRSDMVLLLWLRDYLATLDNIQCLYSHSNIDGATPLMRKLLEYTVYFDYVFWDKNLIEKKALSFAVKHILDLIKVHETLDITNTMYEKDRKILYDAIGQDNAMDADMLRKKANDLKNLLKTCPEYAAIYYDYLSKPNKKKEWYSLYSSATNFRELCQQVGLEAVYIAIYKNYSEKVHTGGAMQGLTITPDKKYYIRNPRIPNSDYVVASLQNLLTFSNIYVELLQYFSTQKQIEIFFLWHLQMTENSKILLQRWEKQEFVIKP